MIAKAPIPVCPDCTLTEACPADEHYVNFPEFYLTVEKVIGMTQPDRRSLLYMVDPETREVRTAPPTTTPWQVKSWENERRGFLRVWNQLTPQERDKRIDAAIAEQAIVESQLEPVRRELFQAFSIVWSAAVDAATNAEVQSGGQLDEEAWLDFQRRVFEDAADQMRDLRELREDILRTLRSSKFKDGD